MQTEYDDMEVHHPVAAGLDVHKMEITATVRTWSALEKATTETRAFSALSSGLVSGEPPPCAGAGSRRSLAELNDQASRHRSFEARRGYFASRKEFHRKLSFQVTLILPNTGSVVVVPILL